MMPKHKVYSRWTDEMEAEACRLHRQGQSYAKIAVALGVSSTLVGKHMRAHTHRAAIGHAGRRFSVGDRVVYHANVYGNTELDGCTGEIIFIDGTECPYTVRFDEPYLAGVTEERVGNVRDNSMRCWFCREENLSLVEKVKTKEHNRTAV